jgi:hypothetical protein
VKTQTHQLRTRVIFAILAISFIFAASLFQDTKAANQPFTPASTPISAQKLSPSPGATTNFGYLAIGNESSEMPAAKTITLCNYTTPSHPGIITQISIYLKGYSGVSHVTAMIFANEPGTNFPKGGDPIAQSSETLNVTSSSSQKYDFTMNCSLSPNTVYWFGYYSDSPTIYFSDASNDSVTVISQPKDGTSNWLPVGWSYQTKTILSLSVLYTYTNVSLSSATWINQLDFGFPQSTLGIWDVFFVLLVIVGETAIVVASQSEKKYFHRWKCIKLRLKISGNFKLKGN